MLSKLAIACAALGAFTSACGEPVGFPNSGSSTSSGTMMGAGGGDSGGAAASSSSTAPASSSSTGGAAASSSSSTGAGAGGPSCVTTQGSSTSCWPYGSVAIQSGLQNGTTCSTPPLYSFVCTAGAAPEGVAGCYHFDGDPTAYCSVDACVRYDPYSQPVCGSTPATPHAWQCDSDTSTLPAGCTGPIGVYSTRCCP